MKKKINRRQYVAAILKGIHESDKFAIHAYDSYEDIRIKAYKCWYLQRLVYINTKKPKRNIKEQLYNLRLYKQLKPYVYDRIRVNAYIHRHTFCTYKTVSYPKNSYKRKRTFHK